MQGQSRFHAPPLTITNKIIIAVCVAVFLLQTFASSAFGFDFVKMLGLVPALVSQGYFHQLLTYPLVQSGFLAVLFNCLIVWFIGGELESKWGSRTYLRFILFSYLGAGVLFWLVMSSFLSASQYYSVPLVGLTGICYALLLAYGILFSERYLTFMLIFPMKAKYFCALLVGIELFMSFAPGFGKSSLGHLAAIFCGLFYLYLKVFVGRQSNSSLRSFLKKREMDKRKKNLKLVSNNEPIERPDKNDPKYWQ